jgi:hypothetical protein
MGSDSLLIAGWSNGSLPWSSSFFTPRHPVVFSLYLCSASVVLPVAMHSAMEWKNFDLVVASSLVIIVLMYALVAHSFHIVITVFTALIYSIALDDCEYFLGLAQTSVG